MLVTITPRGAGVSEGEAVGLVITSRGRVCIGEDETIWEKAFIDEQIKTNNAVKTAFFIDFMENRK